MDARDASGMTFLIRALERLVAEHSSSRIDPSHDESVIDEERVPDETPSIRHEHSKEFILSSNAFARLLGSLRMKPSFAAAARRISEKTTAIEGFSEPALKFHLDAILSELDYAQPENLDVQYEVSISLLDSVKIFRRQCFIPRTVTHTEPEQSSQTTVISDTADTVEMNALMPASLGTKALAGTKDAQKASETFEEGSDNRLTGDQSSQMTPRRFLILVITGASNRLRPSQLASQTLGTVEFAAQLRSEYRRLRGFWKSWFSTDKFLHCDFVKIEKFCADNYSHRGLGLPEGDRAKEYFYQPRPAIWDPPVSREEFRHLFYHCKEPLPSNPVLGGLPLNNVTQNSKTLSRMLQKLSQPWRSAAQVDYPTDTVLRIPQRLRYLDEAGAGREEIWGIHAREERSLKMVCLYILLSLAPSFIFCFLYLFGYLGEADVQNATTPLVISLTCLAFLFASLMGKN